jgi:hypothetical protein
VSVDLLVKAQAVKPEDVGGAIPLALLHRMCWRSEDDGTVRKPVATLAAEIGVNRDTARLALRELEARCWVDAIGETISGGRLPTLYRIVLNPRVRRGLQAERVNATRADSAGYPAGRARVNPRVARDVKNQKNQKNARQAVAAASSLYAPDEQQQHDESSNEAPRRVESQNGQEPATSDDVSMVRISDVLPRVLPAGAPEREP